MIDHILKLLENLTEVFKSAERVIVGTHFSGFRISLPLDRQRALTEIREIYARGFDTGSYYFREKEYTRAQRALLNSITELKNAEETWKNMDGNSL